VAKEVTAQTEDLTQPFDLNDPRLFDMPAPEIDADAIQKTERPAPVADGVHLLALKPSSRAKNGAFYLKADWDEDAGKSYNERVVGSLEVRTVKDDGTDGQFGNEYYVTSTPQPGQTVGKRASSISSMLKLAGKPQRATSLGGIKIELETLFMDLPDNRLVLKGRTRWVLEVPVYDSNNMPVPDGQYNKREKIKGQAKVAAFTLAATQMAVASWEPAAGESAEDFKTRIDDAVLWQQNNPHIYIDPVTDEPIYARFEVAELVEG